MTDADLQRAMALLKLSSLDVRRVCEGSIEKRQEALAELKSKARASYKKAARQLHPDKTKGDPAKAEDFKLLGCFLEYLDRMVPPPPPKRARKGVLRVQFAVHVPISR